MVRTSPPPPSTPPVPKSCGRANARREPATSGAGGGLSDARRRALRRVVTAGARDPPPAPAAAPPVAGSRGRARGMGGAGPAHHHDLTPGYLRPPRRKERPPGRRRRWHMAEGPGPVATPEPEASAILVDGTPAGSDHGTPALPPAPIHAPGRRESRSWSGFVGEGAWIMIGISPAGPATPEPEGGSSMLFGGDRGHQILAPPGWRIGCRCPVPSLLGPNALVLDMSEASLLRSPGARSIESTMEALVRSCCSPFAGAVRDTRTKSRL